MTCGSHLPGSSEVPGDTNLIFWVQSSICEMSVLELLIFNFAEGFLLYMF